MNRRGFLGRLLGMAAAAVTLPFVPLRAAVVRKPIRASAWLYMYKKPKGSKTWSVYTGNLDLLGGFDEPALQKGKQDG